MASLVHEKSSECVDSGLDLFSVNPTQTSILKGNYVNHYPIATLGDGSPIEFYVPSTPQNFTDLSNTYLNISAKIVKADGGNITADDKIFPIPLWSCSLFSQVDCYLNNQLVSRSESNYGYRSFLETILFNSTTVQEEVLQIGCLFRDTPGEGTDVTPANNLGAVKRRGLITTSKPVEMLTRLHCDIAQSDRFIPSGVDIKFRLTQQKNQFQLINQGGRGGYKVVIVKACLFVKRIELQPVVYLALERAAEKNNFLFPLKRRSISHYTIPANHAQFSVENMFLSGLPNKIYVCMVKNSAFLGSWTENPYIFQHNNTNHLSFHHDGVNYPSQPYTPDFANGVVVREFYSLVLNANLSPHSTGITYDQFKDGCSIFAVDFTASPIDDSGVLELRRGGSCRMEIRFGTPLDVATTLIILSEKDEVLQITKDRQIVTDLQN